MGYDYKSIKENDTLHSKTYITTSQTLLGMIPSSLRALGISFTGRDIYFVSVFDKDTTEDDIEDVSAALTEVLPHVLEYPTRTDIDDQYLTIPYPQDIGPYVPNWDLVYLRKEPVE